MKCNFPKNMQSKTKVTSIHFTSVARNSHLTKALLTFMWGIPGRCGDPRRVTPPITWTWSNENSRLYGNEAYATHAGYLSPHVPPPLRLSLSLSVSISAPFYGYLKLIKAKLKGKRSRKKDLWSHLWSNSGPPAQRAAHWPTVLILPP